MEYYSTYQVTVVRALQDLYSKTLTFLPNIVAAIIVVIIGWLLAMFLSKLVLKLLESIKIDHLANQLGLDTLSQRAEKKLSLARLGAWLIKWFFFLGSFIAAANILNLTEVSQFLYMKVVPFAGHVIVAMAVLLLGMLAANFFSDLVSTTVKASGFVSSSTLASITRWLIMLFAVIAALDQLQINTDYIDSLFKAIIAMVAIAGGIAFGLGGKDHAKKVLDEVERGLTK